jgi:hypothetical protein
MAPGVPDRREWVSDGRAVKRVASDRAPHATASRSTSSAERFFSIEGGKGAGALAALDQLVAACSGFRGWLKSNPCPNYELGAHFDAYVAAFGELADEVRTAGLRPIPDGPALRARVKELLQIIEKHTMLLSTGTNSSTGQLLDSPRAHRTVSEPLTALNLRPALQVPRGAPISCSCRSG